MKGRVGRHQNSLFRILKNDMKRREILLNCVDDLDFLNGLNYMRNIEYLAKSLTPEISAEQQPIDKNHRR